MEPCGTWSWPFQGCSGCQGPLGAPLVLGHPVPAKGPGREDASGAEIETVPRGGSAQSKECLFLTGPSRRVNFL